VGLGAVPADRLIQTDLHLLHCARCIMLWHMNRSPINSIITAAIVSAG
jgi:hypothetical protein